MTQEEIESLLLPIHSKLQNIVYELSANSFNGDSFTLHFLGGEVIFLINLSWEDEPVRVTLSLEPEVIASDDATTN